jgi:hypothetical protein
MFVRFNLNQLPKSDRVESPSATERAFDYRYQTPAADSCAVDPSARLPYGPAPVVRISVAPGSVPVGDEILVARCGSNSARIERRA